MKTQMSSKWFHGKNEYNDAADFECLKIYYLPDASVQKIGTSLARKVRFSFQVQISYS